MADGIHNQNIQINSAVNGKTLEDVIICATPIFGTLIAQSTKLILSPGQHELSLLRKTPQM